MMQLTILFTFLATATLGQSSSDYKLYSKVIQDFIDKGIERNVTTSEVLIIAKYYPRENEILFYGKEFLNGDEQAINMFLRYDQLSMQLIKEDQVKTGIISLEKEFYNTPTLTNNHFTLKESVEILTNKKFNSYFKTLFGRRIDKGWKRIYKKYPGAHGVFEFSKIIYSGDYACFYVGRHSNGLSGSGDIVIVQRNNDGWDIIKYLNVWMA